MTKLEKNFETDVYQKHDTDPYQPSARERAFLLLEEDPELYQAVLDLEHEILCNDISNVYNHNIDCPYANNKL